MSEEIEFDYDYLMQRAFRYLMRDVLTMVAELGDAPGEHHFYIEFQTNAPGVEIPENLRKQYPERMTIVLQHQFENLIVTDDQFDVTLWFKSTESRLKIPFDAVTSFADPSTQFGLRFEPGGRDATPGEPATLNTTTQDTDKVGARAPETADGKSGEDKAKKEKPDQAGADIVSLDAFRKK